MNTKQKKQVAEYIEQHLESLADQLMSFPEVADAEALKPIAAGWLTNQVAFYSDRSYRAGEWTAQMIDYLHATGGDLEKAYSLLRHFRNTLIDACLKGIDSISDAEVCALVRGGTDAHFQYLIEYYAQYMRDCGSAEQRKQKAIVEAVNHPLALLDTQGLIEIANREFGRYFNTTPDALAGRDFLALCDDKTSNYIRASLRAKPTGQQSKAFTGTIMHGKQQKAIRLDVQPLYDAAGMRSGAALCLDEKATAESGISAGRQYIEEYLLSDIPIPVQLVDTEGNVTFSSDMIKSLSVRGYDGTEPLCTFLYKQHSGTSRPDPCAQVFETGQFHMEDISYGAEADMRWYLLLLLPLPDETGHVTHVLCGIYDMTRRKQLQKQLEAQIISQQRSSLVAQIAVTVAHQLRNPLSVVLGFAEMMSKGLPPEQYSEAVNRILRNSIRCKDIVENLLDFGKGMPVERRTIDLNLLIRESVRPLLTPAQNRMIEWNYSESAAPIECVPEQMTQVILSMLDNALRAATERVFCTVETKAEIVRLRVVDDGPGISLELRERIFEPFYTTRRHEGAVGLGLSLGRAVAVDYGGNLSVSSAIGNEPNGACLILQMPRIKVAAREVSQDAGQKSLGMGRRVLIVDDEADLLDLLKTALYMRGYLVDAVSTGAEALAKLAENRYDAAVIDFLLLGAMSGSDVYDHIVDAYPELADKVFFITADTLNYQTRLYLEGTRRPVLEKPFLMADFVAELEKLCS